jgi:hypothetical protein
MELDEDDEIIWNGSGIVSGIGPEVAKLLDFKLTLPNRKGEQIVPPPAFCFLPFYVDQDIGWLRSWASFEGLQLFDNPKRDVAYFHAGLRPNEYYLAKAIKLDADRAREDLKVDRKSLDRAAERLQAGRRPVRFDLSPADFAGRIEVLLAECQTLQDQQDKIQRSLSDLYSKRTSLLEQSEIGQYPSSSCRSVRLLQVWSSNR